MSNSQPSASAKALPLAGTPPDSQNGPQPAALSDDLKRALAALDMPAIVALAEEQAWLAVSITGDPEALLRLASGRSGKVRVEAARALGRTHQAGMVNARLRRAQREGLIPAPKKVVRP